MINPTYSFVKERIPRVSLYNRQEWTQFDGAPQSFFFSYSGGFLENEGVGVALFQQNFGLFSVFGGTANFTHNVLLDNDADLTFGVNVDFYRSGIDRGRIISEYSDPVLSNIPNSYVINIVPGVNYGYENYDFGLVLRNFIPFNFSSTKLITDSSAKALEIQIMHTGSVDSPGLFDKSRVTTFLSTEINTDQVVISGLAQIAIQKGVWMRLGYNTYYGFSGGLGANITKKVAIEYNYDVGIGKILGNGISHGFVLAYKIGKRVYSEEEEIGAIIE